MNPKSTTSESFDLLRQIGDGTLKHGIPNIGVGAVDVRDLADIHIAAGFTPEAEGRHIASGHNTGFLEIAQLLNDDYGANYKIPKRSVPKFLLMLIGPLINKALTRKYIRNNPQHHVERRQL